jgi:hypothetical protein
MCQIFIGDDLRRIGWHLSGRLPDIALDGGKRYRLGTEPRSFRGRLAPQDWRRCIRIRGL